MKNEGNTVLDIGNTSGTTDPSAFYDMERDVFFKGN